LIAKDVQAFAKLRPYLLDANVALVKGNLIKNLLQVELNDICPLITFEGENASDRGCFGSYISLFLDHTKRTSPLTFQQVRNSRA
jgi:hypothetical protein